MSRSGDGTAPRMRRSLVGVSVDAAEQVFADLERDFATKKAALEAEIVREHAESERLQAEIARLQERLGTAHTTVNVLRSKLAQERAARAVLVARLMDQPDLAEQAKPHKEKQLDEIRLDAESEREAEALRDLVEQLYRTAYAHGALPPGLQVKLPQPQAAQPLAGSRVVTEQKPPAPPPDAAPEPAPPAGVTSTRWHGFLAGKVVGKTLKAQDGTVIAKEGERITSAIIEAADQAGLLFELILPMRMTATIQEL